MPGLPGEGHNSASQFIFRDPQLPAEEAGGGKARVHRAGGRRGREDRRRRHSAPVRGALWRRELPGRHHPHRVGGDRYRPPLRGRCSGAWGSSEAKSLPIASRADCERREWLDILDQVDGVFLTGGNQLRLSTMIGGTEVAKALRRRNAEGMHVAGTSAGAAFLCEHMIAFGKEGRVAARQDRDAGAGARASPTG